MQVKMFILTQFQDIQIDDEVDDEVDDDSHIIVGREIYEDLLDILVHHECLIQIIGHDLEVEADAEVEVFIKNHSIL